MFCVHTPAARPYTTSLPIAIASSSSSNGITDSTGPNTSSCAMRIAVVDAGEDRRLDEPAVAALGATSRCAAEHGLRAFRLRDVDVVEHLLELRLRW